jgi:hypothetical protein
MLNALKCAALIALAVILLPALALATIDATIEPSGGHGALLLALSALGLLVGAVTITYNFQPSGTHVPVSSTTAPTAAQARHFNSIAALVTYAEADTTATVTHNWGMTAAEAQQYQPWVSIYTVTSGTAVPLFSINVANTNAVVVDKTAANGTSGSFCVILQRPNSIVT